MPHPRRRHQTVEALHNMADYRVVAWLDDHLAVVSGSSPRAGHVLCKHRRGIDLTVFNSI